MRGIKIGSAFGIPIRLNWTFLIVLPLFAYLIGSQVGMIAEVMNETAGLGIDATAVASGTTPWVLGLSAVIGLFVGVLLHEFGHSLVAMRYGYEIESITLWLLGGLASFAEFPEDWRHEFWIAIAGPLVSVAVGIACYGVVLVAPVGSNAVLFVFGYLALLNIVLAVFNMLPAFPMDGGRVLRALLARNQPHAQATQRAASVGKVFAFLMGIFGLFTFQLLLIVLAFFVYIAASGEAQQTTLKAAFEDVTVGDVMTPREGLHTVTEDTSVGDLMSRMFEERHTGYPVLDGDELVGMVTLEDARSVREVERDAYRVDDVMVTDLVAVDPDADALTALQTMQEHGVGRLPVVDADGELVGLISRSDLMTAFNIIQTGGTPGVISGRRQQAGEEPRIL
ncbi:CBS domain-containing protein [Halorubrum ezzemoulense]|jgi:Zn-dependent protease/CBS domain-containing protein|uniref:Zinc metalloprotease n=2 Tax=Halorubrum ezzemoulense TaxID=337243 RepID=A0A256JXB4_HALEZ|nr:MULTISPECIES: CBS domain-containing protein [Halorubrum]MDB2225576.1 CBS domain-containing protein [Halorubrum ezzemoulense]MDB2238424.1 CBS domain-containing protein [Halorubrum ezzemoulense]MDB2239910.1 CBS domain-containing protein [Halorubrum ezzemoulense]MDB2244143.1 CBS domain-containing protein [Halorubrum ezzemoulense]MDB2247894.1 CBS domain-containing protein [Halorubrum ezzemoulense]